MADEPTAGLIQANLLAPLIEMLRRAEYLGWLVEFEEQIIGGGGIILRRLLPHPGTLYISYEVYILNVYIEPAHRRRGVGSREFRVWHYTPRMMASH